jgi:hypothetical protein
MPKLTPLRAIRAKCIHCCCGSRKEVRLCTATRCPLWPYRLGHRPGYRRKKDSPPADLPTAPACA